MWHVCMVYLHIEDFFQAIIWRFTFFLLNCIPVFIFILCFHSSCIQARPLPISCVISNELIHCYFKSLPWRWGDAFKPGFKVNTNQRSDSDTWEEQETCVCLLPAILHSLRDESFNLNSYIYLLLSGLSSFPDFSSLKFVLHKLPSFLFFL